MGLAGIPWGLRQPALQEHVTLDMLPHEQSNSVPLAVSPSQFATDAAETSTFFPGVNPFPIVHGNSPGIVFAFLEVLEIVVAVIREPQAHKLSPPVLWQLQHRAFVLPTLQLCD